MFSYKYLNLFQISQNTLKLPSVVTLLQYCTVYTITEGLRNKILKFHHATSSILYLIDLIEIKIQFFKENRFTNENSNIVIN